MRDYILLMHNDARHVSPADADAAWAKYLEMLNQSGRFFGGSAVGGGKCFAQSGAAGKLTSHLTGYIRVQAADMEQAQKFLAGNPVFEAGGTVEIRELPQS